MRAPVDGEVLQVNVRPGEYVGTPPAQALIVLGDISTGCTSAWTSTSTTSRASSRTRRRRRSLRGSPARQYPLEFVRVEPYVIPKKSLTGDNTERVDTRVLQVIYALDRRRDRPVYVGQQLDVFIDVAK